MAKKDGPKKAKKAIVRKAKRTTTRKSRKGTEKKTRKVTAKRVQHTTRANAYERNQATKIVKWKEEEPGVISEGFGVILAPLVWLVRQVVPEAAMRAALDSVNSLGEWLADTGDIKREGGVSKISDLRSKDMKLSDSIADEVQNWAIGCAVAEGAVTGAGGILTAPVDIPAIMTIATRTIHKIGLCYGFECKTKRDRDFVLGILAASGANEMAEKVAALTVLRSIQVTIAKVTWKRMAQIAARQQLSKEGAIIAIKNLAKQLGINLTKRKALAAIPFVGAFVGGSVNGWYIKEVGWAARRVFQERWLVHNRKNVALDLLTD